MVTGFHLAYTVQLEGSGLCLVMACAGVFPCLFRYLCRPFFGVSGRRLEGTLLLLD